MSAEDFRPIGALIADHARARPDRPALVMGDERLSWSELDELVDRVAASLQRDGLRPGDAVVLAGGSGSAGASWVV